MRFPPHIVNPLTVAIRGDKKRLVLDCRHINHYIKMSKITIEGLEVLVNFLHSQGYMITFDIIQGYIPIHPLFIPRSFLGFASDDRQGVTRYFRFLMLPFGLASATYIFTKIFWQFIKAWRVKVCTQ